MKRMRSWLIKLAALVLLGATQGCALLLIGAGAGAAIGVSSYEGNELRVTQDVPLNRAWAAATAAMREMEFAVSSADTHKDGLGGLVQGRTAKDQVVRIQLIRQTDTTTEIRVRVGEFDTVANKAATQALYDKLKAHL